MVKKGIILSIEGNRARVAPADDIDMVSGYYDIPPYLRPDDYTKLAEAIDEDVNFKSTLSSLASEKSSEDYARMAEAVERDINLRDTLKQLAEEMQLKKGDQVAFVSFPDCTGAILAKL